MMESRAEWERKGQSPISPSVRAHPAQNPELSISQTPEQGVSAAGGVALEEGNIFLKV